MKSFLSIWLMLWLCAASAGGHSPLPHDVPDCEPQIVSVMAAKSEGATRPVAGWQAVILPDNWSQRWPDYDGTVWYRIDWQPGCVDTDNGDSPVGLVIESIIMAGACPVFYLPWTLAPDHCLADLSGLDLLFYTSTL